MKYKLLRFSLLSILLMLCGGNLFAADPAEFKDFSAIVNNQEGTLLTADELVQGTPVELGIAVAEDGTVNRVAATDASSIATITGKYHSEHGLTAMKVIVAVPGSVKIQVGQCTYSSKDIVVTNSNGETVATATPATACWKNDRSNVTELVYEGDATTLTITGMQYCPFIAVKEYVAPAEFKDFSAIVNNQEGTLLTADEQVQGTAVELGIAVAEDGTVSRVAATDASSIATITGKYHSEHGLTAMKVIVAVPGSVKIQVGQCTYSSKDIVVTNSNGETVATATPATACWKNDRSNVTELVYEGDATTLTITGMQYCPFIAVKEYVAPAEFKDFSAIVNNQEGTLLTADEQVQGTPVELGIAVAEDGTASRVAATDASSIATITGKYHSDHGLTGMKVVVAVPGSVKIQVGQCTYSSKDIVVTNSDGETVATATPATACWKNDRSNVTELVYEGDATTLTITGMSYCPFIAVAKTETSDNPTVEDVTGTWDYGNADVMSATMGFSGSSESGEVEAIEKNGLKMTVEANGASFRNNGNNIQVGSGAVFKVPVKNIGDLVTVKGFPGYSKYTIGNSTEVLTDENTYKAKTSDVEKGYVAITSADNNNYYYSISVTQYAPKEATTLDNEAVTATFPFNLGTDGQTATFGDDADYFLSSKVVYGSNLSIVGQKNPNGMTEMVMTAFQPAAKETAADMTNNIIFLINPRPGFTFTPTKVSFKATRYGTNGSAVDVAWLNPDETTASLATGKIPNRNDGTNPKEDDGNAKYSEYSFDVTEATAAEGQCGLKLNLYNLDSNKQVGFCDIIIEGTLSGTEKEMPILASFKMNGTEYAADDVFEADGTDFVGTVELSKSATMVSESNPLTEITAASGELGSVTYESTDSSCKVTIPMTAGETSVNYILNIVQKPDFTLTYIGLDGTAIGTQTVEKDAAIGEFAIDIESVTGAKEGYKARGWFKHDRVGAKYKTTDAVTANISLYAVETEIEVSSDSKKYTFDLTDANFDDADHEGFNSIGNGYWHDNQHGWAFQNGDKIELLVGKKASVTLSLCQYSADAPINASNGETIASAKVDTDGGMQTVEYEGEAGTLTLTFNGTAYVHSITILNTSSTNYIREGNTFTVFAGDASSFLDALDAANGVSGSELVTIYLPNGTYDLGPRALTRIGRDNITIKGESQDGVIIKNRPEAEGISVSATLLNSSKYLMLENLTLKNDYPFFDPATGKPAANAGRAVCLQDKGNYTVCKNVTMLSYQDTYYSNNNKGQFYFVDCEIHGLVDYVCGGGDVFFDNVLFYNESREMTQGKGDVTIAAPNGAKQYGYVMQNCTVDTHSASFNWGRSWGAPSYLRWLNTTLKQPNKLVSTRFTVNGMNCAADGFYEYNTMNESGDNITPASNVIEFTHSSGNKKYETIIDATEAANYTKEKVFENAPDLFKERIGFGTVGISTINAAVQQDLMGIYNLAGQRVDKSFKGIVIINGKKILK